MLAWPLVKQYPGRAFQSGLFGTWMFPENNSPLTKKDFYTDVEGGLGWWNDTEYATETPKFIMGGVQLNFSGWANGPVAPDRAETGATTKGNMEWPS